MEAKDFKVTAACSPSDVSGSPGLPQEPTSLQSTSLQDDDASKTLSVMYEEPQTVHQYRGHTWKHTRIPVRLFRREDGKEQAVVDPQAFRLYFGLPLKAFEILTNPSTPHIQKLHVNFNSSGVDSTSDLVEYFTRQTDVHVRLSNCCNRQKIRRLRSFEFLFPRHLLQYVRIQIKQCDHLALNIFDAATFAHVTDLSLSEHFLRINEPWSTKMLNHFEDFPGNLRELALPLPLYVSLDFVNSVTGFLLFKKPQVGVTFTNVVLKLGDEAFRGLSPEHVSAVKDLLVTAGDEEVRLGRLDSGAMEELLRPSWAVESSALRKTLKK